MRIKGRLHFAPIKQNLRFFDGKDYINYRIASGDDSKPSGGCLTTMILIILIFNILTALIKPG